MNLKRKFFSGKEKEEERFNYEDEQLIYNLSKTLCDWIPESVENIVLVCIGTDRSTGDALGPLIGTLLNEQSLKYISVYGTLDQPIHAVNLQDKLFEIQERHNNPFIIGIDACLGKVSSIGMIVSGKGPVKPGAAVKKELPDVGNLHVTGIVNVSGFMEYFVLQNTRLNLVMHMAKKIASSFQKLDRRLLYRTANANPQIHVRALEEKADNITPS